MNKFSKVLYLVTLILLLGTMKTMSQDSIINIHSSLDTVSDVYHKVDILNQLSKSILADSVLQSHSYAQEAFDLALKNNYSLGKADACLNVATIELERGKDGVALDHLLKSLGIYTDLGDSLKLAETHNLLGKAYSNTQQVSEAISSYKKSLEIYQDIGEEQKMALVLFNTGMVYHKSRQLDSALAYYNHALNINQSLDNANQLGYNYANIGSVHMAKNNAIVALHYFEESLDQFKKTEDSKGTADAYLNIGDAYKELGNYALALENTLKCLEICERNKIIPLLVKSYLSAAELYEINQDAQISLKYYKAHLFLKDSLNNYESNRLLINTQTIQLANAENREMARVQALNVEQIKSEKTKNMLLTVVAACILICMILLSISYLKRQRIAVQITEQNEKIKLQKDKIFEQAKSIKEANKELREKNDNLNILNEEKNYLMNVVAHDLKSPLNQINGLANVIGLEKGKLNETQQECLEKIRGASARLSNMIAKILDTNTIESNISEINHVRVDIKPLINQIAMNYSEMAVAKNIRLNVSCNVNEAFALVDINHIEQVFENLMSNAIKFSPKGKKINVHVYESESSYVVEVADQGPGLTEDDKLNLFKEFAILSAKPTGNEKSTGLGLAIVKNYVEKMGGKVWCESELGKGASFKVQFAAA